MTPQREEAARLLRVARRDQAALQALLGASGVGLAAAFFHAQQAAEKALKAVMCLYSLEYRRTHDLEELAGRLADAGQALNVAEADLRLLTPYAVEYRHDDEAPELLSATQAQAIVDAVLAWGEEQIELHRLFELGAWLVSAGDTTDRWSRLGWSPLGAAFHQFNGIESQVSSLRMLDSLKSEL